MLHSLEYLDISRCPRITERGIASLSSLKCCCSLLSFISELN